MKYAQAKSGRVFVVRLEDQEVVHEEIERFARNHNIKAASLIILGAADRGSVLVAGPQQADVMPVVPKTYMMDNVHEVVGAGTLFPDEKGVPVLHMHMACGRGISSVAGCVRNGVRVWQVMEVVLQELVDFSGTRRLDSDTGFELLEP